MQRNALLTTLILIVSLNCIGQGTDTIAKKNILKLNLSSLLFKAASIQYERVIHKKFSLTTNIIYRPKSSFSPIFIEDNWHFIQEQYRNFSITPAIRYYYGKKQASGLYSELYMRYRNDKISFLHTPGSSTDGFSTVGNENMVMAGINSGVQVFKKDNLVIDFWILGVGYGYTSFQAISEYDGQSFGGVPNPLDQIDKDNYESIMKNAYGDEATISWNNNTATIKRSSALIPIRALGFNVGIRF